MPTLAHLALFATLAAPAWAETRQSVTIPVAGGALAGVLFAPDTTPAPAVLVLHTAYGKVEAADERYARSLAGEGFVALAVSYVEGRRGGRLEAGSRFPPHPSRRLKVRRGGPSPAPPRRTNPCAGVDPGVGFRV